VSIRASNIGMQAQAAIDFTNGTLPPLQGTKSMSKSTLFNCESVRPSMGSKEGTRANLPKQLQQQSQS